MYTTSAGGTPQIIEYHDPLCEDLPKGLAVPLIRRLSVEVQIQF